MASVWAIREAYLEEMTYEPRSEARVRVDLESVTRRGAEFLRPRNSLCDIVRQAAA